MGNRLPTRTVDAARVRAKLEAARSKPVKLRVAASLLHYERTGRNRSSMRGPDYLQQLNEAARALADAVDVYHMPDGKMELIPRQEVASATFSDGGNLLRTAAGTVYRSLALRRGSAIAAITVLGKAKAES